MIIRNAERQYGTNLTEIRADHVHRYRWAASRSKGDRIVDAACGVGYGCAVLADEGGCTVLGLDRSDQAIQFARQHWNHNPNISYIKGDLYKIDTPEEQADKVVCFEALEHLVDPGEALRRFRKLAPRLYASVPNEVGFPFRGYDHHVRHYTPNDFEALLAENGWDVVEWYGQKGPESPVEKDLMDGRTIIAVCERNDSWTKPEDSVDLRTPEEVLGGPVPNVVAIVAMGTSRGSFFDETLFNWGTVADEVWAINSMGGLVQWDRCFHQDDIRVQEARASAGQSKISHMLSWMKKSDGPIYTSRAYEDYPGTVEYPLEWVVNRVGNYYHNSTVAYAVTFAIAIGVKEIKLYGADFAYPNMYKREKGRGCVEFWLGVASARGIKVSLPIGTTMMDQDKKPRDRLYGYDTEWVTVQQVNGRFKVVRVDRLPEDVPSAEEMEIRYSHDPKKENKAPPKKE